MNRTFPRILLIDDDVTFNYIMSRFFELWKWDTRRAHSVADSERIISSGEKFDIVMIDLMLPDGDGSSLVSVARSVCKCSKVVIVTAKDDVTSAETTKPDLILKKPYFLEPLRDLMSKVWDDFFSKRRLDIGGSRVFPRMGTDQSINA